MADKEYIERGALLSMIYDAPIFCTYGAEGYFFRNVARDITLRQPTADVVEVRRGEWIYHECVSSYDGYSCSECCVFVDEEMFDADEFHKSFCGNCGADMRGNKDDSRKENQTT